MIKVTLITNNPRKTIMAEDTKTVKQILVENDVNFANAATSLDGATLSASEMGKSLRDLGVEDKVVISVLAHKDNAASAVVIGASCVITSTLTKEVIKKFKKYHPEALTLMDEDDEPVFAIGLDEEGTGSIDKNGAIYGATTDASGHAQITVVVNPTAEDKKQLLADKIGRALLNLADLEEQLTEALPELDAEIEEINNTITEM